MSSSLGGYGGFSAATGYGGNATGLASGKRGGGPGDVIPKGYRKGQLNQFTPEQTQLFEQMFGQVSPDSYLSRLSQGDEELFNEMEAPALKQFSGLQGGIASRFSQGGGGPGAMSSRRSSGHQNTQTAAASDFAQQLQSNRQTLQRQAIQDLMGLSNQLLGQRPTEQFLSPKKQQSSSGLGGAIGAGLGGAGGFFAGGPAGALAGSQLGYGIGSAF